MPYLGVHEKKVILLEFISAYLVTVTVETITLYGLLRKRYPGYIIVRNSLIANTTTLPFVWFFFPSLGFGWIAQTTLAELFAFLTEAGIYRLLFDRMRLEEALAASFVCNLLSFGLGLAI